MTETPVQENVSPIAGWEAYANDDVSKALFANQIVPGFEAILAANEILLESDSGTGVREIDKALKDYKGENENIVKAYQDFQKKQEAAKKAQEKVRNLFRTEELHEDEKQDEEVDKDAVKVQRQMVIDAINLLSTFCKTNGNTELENWLNGIQVPQVGRQGSSSAVGVKKPRAQVTVSYDGKSNVFDSFGDAAKHLSSSLSSEDNKVVVSSGDLVEAWTAANEAEEFDFRGYSLTVVPKVKASA